MIEEESPLSALAALARVCQIAKREKNTETQCLGMVALPTGWMHVLARMWYERRDKCEQLDDKAFLLDSATKIKKNLSIPVRKNREHNSKIREGQRSVFEHTVRLCGSLPGHDGRPTTPSAGD